MKKNSLAMTSLFITSILWGSGFVAIKYAVQRMDSYWFIAIRFIIAAVVTAAVFFKRYKNVTAEDFKRGVALGLTLSVALTLQILGCFYTTVGKNAFLCSIYVVIIPFLHWFRTKVRPNAAAFAAAAVCTAGTAVISLGTVNGINLGDILSILSGAAWAVNFELISDYSQKSDMISLQIVQLPVGAVSTLIVALIASPIPNSVDGGASLCIIYTAVFCVSIAFLLQLYGQKSVSSTVSGMIFALESVFAGFFSVIFLGEHITARLWIGGGLILFSVVLGCVDLQKLKLKFSRQ